MRKKVVIIDYKLGNLFSVKQACDTVGIYSIVSSEVSEILNADALILPGVGAFQEAMHNLVSLGLDRAIISQVEKGIPIFGICLGLQLLFDKSEEFGNGNGLGIISGLIKKFPDSLNDKRVKVPHIAWNKIKINNSLWKKSPLANTKDNEFMYFVHSYYVIPNNINLQLTNTNYDGIDFCSSIFEKNIFATQFHPEKSAEKGLSIYKYWAESFNLV